MEKHFMVDIETTGTNAIEDDILEVGAVEIAFRAKFGIQNAPEWWIPTGRHYSMQFHTGNKATSEFAKKHMQALYDTCNALPVTQTVESEWVNFRNFIHAEVPNDPLKEIIYNYRPRFFMGWNATQLDLPFLFQNGMLTPSYHKDDPLTGKDTLMGDAHYRVYEQTGAVNFLCNSTGFDRKLIEQLALQMNPVPLKMPEGQKEHNGLYDCYHQINLMNGLIAIGRKHGIGKF